MSSHWKWGQEPPAWIMKEFKKALHLMGKNNEVIHLFDTGPDWSFVIAIAPTKKAHEAARTIAKALSGETINSEAYYPSRPRHAVHGDLYP